MSILKKIYFLLCAGILFILCSGIFYIFPYYNKIIATNKKIYENRIQLAIYEQQRQNIEKTRIDYNKIKNDIDNISQIFIPKENILNLVDFLENLSKNNQLTQNVNLNNLDQKGNDKIIKMNVNIVGQWGNLMNYLSDLESANYYFIIDDFKLSTVDNIINFNFVLSLYTNS